MILHNYNLKIFLAIFELLNGTILSSILKLCSCLILKVKFIVTVTSLGSLRGFETLKTHESSVLNCPLNISKLSPPHLGIVDDVAVEVDRHLVAAACEGVGVVAADVAGEDLHLLAVAVIGGQVAAWGSAVDTATTRHVGGEMSNGV